MLCNVISYNKSGSNRYHINLLALSLLASLVVCRMSFTRYSLLHYASLRPLSPPSLATLRPSVPSALGPLRGVVRGEWHETRTEHNRGPRGDQGTVRLVTLRSLPPLFSRRTPSRSAPQGPGFAGRDGTTGDGRAESVACETRGRWNEPKERWTDRLSARYASHSLPFHSPRSAPGRARGASGG